MSSAPQFRSYDGWGNVALRDAHFNQTVRIGNVIKISGQGGWDPSATRMEDVGPSISDDVDAQTDQAFANVEIALKDAGGKGWQQVYSIRSLHVGLDAKATAAMTRNLRKYCPETPPIWTEYGVAALGLPEMRVEIEVEAFDG